MLVYIILYPLIFLLLTSSGGNPHARVLPGHNHLPDRWHWLHGQDADGEAAALLSTPEAYLPPCAAKAGQERSGSY